MQTDTIIKSLDAHHVIIDNLATAVKNTPLTDANSHVLTVIGMGKLGLPMAAFYARSGYKVFGLDLNDKLINNIKTGVFEDNEPYLRENLRQKPVHFTSDYSSCIPISDIIVVLVETPIDNHTGLHNLLPLYKCIDMIKSHITNKKPIVCISSTVLPGTAQQVQDRLESKAIVVSTPSLATIGRIFEQLLTEPFSVIIGTQDSENTTEAKIIEDLWLKAGNESNLRFSVMNSTNAELSKILFLAYLNHQVSYGNFMSELCEKVPGGDVEVVISAISKDPRFNTAYMYPGIGAGGPCLPRDTRTLSEFAKNYKVFPRTIDAITSSNDWQIHRIFYRITKILNSIENCHKIAILGLTYKSGYKCLEASQGMKLAMLLKQRGYSVTAYDLLIRDGKYEDVTFCDIKTTLEGASLAVLCHNDSNLDALLDLNLYLMKKRNVISVFRHNRHNADYFFIGKNK